MLKPKKKDLHKTNWLFISIALFCLF